MSDEKDPVSGETVPPGASLPFPNPTETALDYDGQALSRVALQYKRSTRFLATTSMLVAPLKALEDCLVTIPPLDDPAIATGVNLDVTGELVGQRRVLADGTSLNDATYRLLIARRIVRNMAKGTSPEFVAFLIFVFQTYPGTATPFRYYDVGGMAIGIEYGGGAAPSSDQLALLGDNPAEILGTADNDSSPTTRAMAVGADRGWYDPDEYFAFDEDTGPGAKGFGEEGDDSLGGKFAEIF